MFFQQQPPAVIKYFAITLLIKFHSSHILLAFMSYYFLLLSKLKNNWQRRDCDRHGLGPKPTRVILSCPWDLLVGLGEQF